MKPILVIGLGNTLLRDEGVGMHLLAALQAQADRYPNADFLDLGIAGLALLHHLEGRRKVILLDCAYMDEPPGTLRRFTPEDVVSLKTLAGFSLHEGDLLQVLELARKLNLAPPELVIFGIQPEEVGPGEGLSEGLRGRLEGYVARVGEEVEG